MAMMIFVLICPFFLRHFLICFLDNFVLLSGQKKEEESNLYLLRHFVVTSPANVVLSGVFPRPWPPGITVIEAPLRRLRLQASK
jgi:hypothetical protein